MYQFGDAFCESTGQNLFRIAARDRIDGFVPWRLLGVVLPRNQGPKLDPALIVQPTGPVPDRISVGRQPLSPLAVENRIHEIEDRGGRAVRGLEPGFTQFGTNPVELLIEMRPHRPERFRLCPLERVDRLLLVTDNKDRAPAGPRPFARKELLSDSPDHLPLGGRGVLRLVNQDVVNSLVELVEHPGPHMAFVQHGGCARHQIVEIQKLPRHLGVVHPAEQRRREAVEIAGPRRRPRRKNIVARPQRPFGQYGKLILGLRSDSLYFDRGKSLGSARL